MMRIFAAILLFVSFVCVSFAEPNGGALDGERYRVLISSDIGGSDDDDDQSLVHYLHYADLFDLEGLVSSPPHAGRTADYLKVIDLYESDFASFKAASPKFPTPETLRDLCKQGATEPAPAAGFRQPTDGSKWIIECARRNDPRPLYVLVWGSITDVAQALHDDPSIKEKIRVYFIASWNQRMDEHAFAYIDQHHSDLWMIYCDTTFRGWYVGGKQDGDWGNQTFINAFIKESGALGKYFAPLKNNAIKMGDTPSVAYLLKGDPNNPESPHWGGRFIKQEGRKHWWRDDQSEDLREKNFPGAKTVNRWRKAYLADWRDRLAKIYGNH
ncbi:MAG: DUF1593 domain-containing protein [Candidatus Hinthialibacter antarcticus]|nr:DUF1593 domain-containing protein [Candidatus Hinthialibacter antarcticus]